MPPLGTGDERLEAGGSGGSYFPAPIPAKEAEAIEYIPGELLAAFLPLPAAVTEGEVDGGVEIGCQGNWPPLPEPPPPLPLPPFPLCAAALAAESAATVANCR